MTEKIKLEAFEDFLGRRARNANKSDFGHVLVIGGDFGYSGAVQMAGFAALRVGAGLVSIATQPEHARVLNINHPELMCHGVTKSADLKPLMAKATVIIVGPGLGKSAWAEELLFSAVKTEKNLVVDADGLNILAEKPQERINWILTPHPGEAGRLLKMPTEAIQKNRLDAVMNLQKKFGGVSVLKGAGTLVAGPNGEIAICEAGNPGMASGGTGDILSGVIGGFVAQGLDLLSAAKLGVLVHAMAGDMAAKTNGERGMVATDLYPFLRQLVNRK